MEYQTYKSDGSIALKVSKIKRGMYAICSVCGKIKLIYSTKHTLCKNCCAKYYKPRYDYKNIYTDKRIGKWGEVWRLRKYDLTKEEFENMIINQNNKCAICEKDFTRTPNVDHCHKTEKVRGLLCTKCNVSLGHIEKENWLEKALNYLNKHKH